MSPLPEKPARAGVATKRVSKKPVDLGTALVEAFLTNESVNQTLIGLIAPGIWSKRPPSSHLRTIASTFAHIHNVRCTRMQMSMPDRPAPARLDRAVVTMAQARAALRKSALAMVTLIQRSLAAGGRVPDFKPDIVALTCAEIMHEAHHRGQICHWARELAAPISPEHQTRLWKSHTLQQGVDQNCL